MQNSRVLTSYHMLSLAGLYMYHQLATPSQHITQQHGDYMGFSYLDAESN